VNSVAKDDVIWVTPTVEGVPLNMELETGSAVTIISKADYKHKFCNMKLRDTELRLRTYTGEKIKPLGVLIVTVEINNQTQRLDVVVVDRRQYPIIWKRLAECSTVKLEGDRNSFSKSNKRASKRGGKYFEEVLRSV